MDGFDITYAGAFAAGLLSFLSPCVLPLVPPYLAYLGGLSIEELTARQKSGQRDVGAGVFLAALAFVAGFTTVFVALGASASAIGQAVSDQLDLLAKIAGGVIIVMGLHFLGVLRLAPLYREARFRFDKRPAGLAGAYVIGLAFAFGWTPCVGPILAAILFVAASEESATGGALLLAVYALGIGIPFLAASFAAKPFMAFMARFRRAMGYVEKTMGALLVGTGVLFLTGGMADIAFWLLETFPAFGQVG